jgi:hypothetical protein
MMLKCKIEPQEEYKTHEIDSTKNNPNALISALLLIG